MLLIVIDGFFIEPNNIVVEEINIFFKNLPQSFEGYKIVHITDLHLKSYGEREEKILNIIRKIKPDIIVVTGDLIEDKQYIDIALKFMEKLTEIAPTYFVFGNWDHMSGISIPLYRTKLVQRHVIVLINQNVKLIRGSEYIYLIGVDDPHTFNDNLDKALENISGDTVKILLAHSPEIIDKAVEKNIDLVLVGHTHGGQIRLPIIGPLYMPLPSKYRKYDMGMFKIKNTIMYVNRGIGTTFIPIRFQCPPEITIFYLKKGGCV